MIKSGILSLAQTLFPLLSAGLTTKWTGGTYKPYFSSKSSRVISQTWNISCNIKPLNSTKSVCLFCLSTIRSVQFTGYYTVHTSTHFMSFQCSVHPRDTLYIRMVRAKVISKGSNCIKHEVCQNVLSSPIWSSLQFISAAFTRLLKLRCVIKVCIRSPCSRQ